MSDDEGAETTAYYDDQGYARTAEHVVGASLAYRGGWSFHQGAV